MTCGTAASSPTAPAIPAGAFELARNTMTSAATTTASTGNTITQTAPYTAPRGGVVYCRTTTERDALTASAITSNPITISLDGVLWTCNDATTWRPLVPLAPLVTAYSNGDYTTAVTVATRTFTAETGKTYRVTAGLYGTQITNTGVPTVKLLDGGSEVFRMATGATYAATTSVCGTPAVLILVGDGASHTVSVTAQSTASALRIAASGVNYLVVEQIA